MSHASADHRNLDRQYAEALARDGEPGNGQPLVASRNRLKDMRTMSASRVLLVTLSRRTSTKGNEYLAGWLGKASVVAFPGEPDRFGNPTWDVFLKQPEPRDGPPAARQRAQGDKATDGEPAQPPAAAARPGGSYRAARREGDAARRERVSAEIASGLGVHSDSDLNDEIGF